MIECGLFWVGETLFWVGGSGWVNMGGGGGGAEMSGGVCTA